MEHITEGTRKKVETQGNSCGRALGTNGRAKGTGPHEMHGKRRGKPPGICEERRGFHIKERMESMARGTTNSRDHSKTHRETSDDMVFIKKT